MNPDTEAQGRLFRRFGSLVAGGVPLLRALEVAGQATDDADLSAAVQRIVARAFGGSSLSDAFGEEGIFSPEILALLAEGERAGDIEVSAIAAGEGLLAGVFAIREPEGQGDAALDRLLARAKRAQSTEIHLEPAGDLVRLRFRSGGVLRDEEALTPQRGREIVRAVLRRLVTARSGFESGEVLAGVGRAPVVGGDSLTLRLFPILRDPPGDLSPQELSTLVELVEQAVGETCGRIDVGGAEMRERARRLADVLAALDRDRRRVILVARHDVIRIPGVTRLIASPGPGGPDAETAFAQAVGLAPDLLVVHDLPLPSSAPLALLA